MLFISALTLAGLLPFPGGLGTGGASCVPPPAGPEARFALRMVEGLVEGDEEVVVEDHTSLPVPLDRVLLNEEGGASEPGVGVNAVEDACALLCAAHLDGGEQLSLTLCDDPCIRKLNAQWRSVDSATDVLSFPMDDDQLLGDLVISIDTARRQAEERHHSLRDELRILMVHGVLHLLGYDHEADDQEYEDMVAAERKLLLRLGWKGQGLIDAASGVEA